MTQSFIQPKGTLKPQIGLEDLQKQYAQAFITPQVQAQATETQPDAMRKTVQDYLNNKLMQEIEVPKFTTIQDIFNAHKGEKLNAFGSYLNSPSGQNLIGGVLGLLSGGALLGSPDDSYSSYLRHDMDNRQLQAMAQLKEQNDIATALNNAYKQMDIEDLRDKRARELAEQELKYKREENALDRALRREQMSNDLQRAMIIHGALNGGGSGGGTATGGAASIDGTPDLSNVKFTAADRKSLTENKTTLANIEAGLKSLEENPNAYSFLKGVLGSDITNRIDPKGVATRTQIDNITAVYRKWLTGAQMSDRERKAYERFLPAPTDNYNIVKAKLNGMKGAIERSNEALLSNYGISSTANNDPLGLGI